MRLCIDASNLRVGGGLTHLIELLGNVDAPAHGFERVFVWSSAATLGRISDRPWLEKRAHPVLEKGFARRAVWQSFRLGPLARADGCDLIFAPGGSFATPFRPVVTMCRNMLPFEWREMARYGMSLQRLRLWLLRFAQARSFRRASGTIFLTHYAYNAVLGLTGPLTGPTQIIPHGIDSRFFATPRLAQSHAEASIGRPIDLIYVSIIDHYKHQASAAQAVVRLAKNGFPLRLTLIGPAYPPALRYLESVLSKIDPEGRVVRYLGPAAYADIHAAYANADMGLFASSCENMPNILLEQMAAGLPIACSDRGPMPEILGEAGVFFDPERVESISTAIFALATDSDLRTRMASAAQERARQYSWTRCADETFDFLARIAVMGNNNTIGHQQ